MFDLHKQLSATKGEHERTMLQRQIEATDWADQPIVYELYRPMEEDVGVVRVLQNS